MNGYKANPYFDSEWIDIMTHYFVVNGTFVVSVYDLIMDLRRKDLIPNSLKSVILRCESNNLITVFRKESSRNVFQRFVTWIWPEELSSETLIRCDYLLNPAISFISEELPERTNCSFFLLSLTTPLSHFLAQNKDKLESDLQIQISLLKEAACQVVPDKTYPIDDFESQSRALLRNLTYQQSLYVAVRCSELGIGSYRSRNEVEALLLCWIPEGVNDLDRFVYTAALSRLQKKLESIESDIKMARRNGRKGVCRNDKEARRDVLKEVNRKRSEQRSTLDRIQALKAKLQRIEERKRDSRSNSLDCTQLKSVLCNEMGSVSEIQGPSNGFDSLT